MTLVVRAWLKLGPIMKKREKISAYLNWSPKGGGGALILLYTLYKKSFKAL